MPARPRNTRTPRAPPNLPRNPGPERIFALLQNEPIIINAFFIFPAQIGTPRTIFPKVPSFANPSRRDPTGIVQTGFRAIHGQGLYGTPKRYYLIGRSSRTQGAGGDNLPLVPGNNFSKGPTKLCRPLPTIPPAAVRPASSIGGLIARIPDGDNYFSF
jgi:hypothetical protein